jgi:hypothetical protein
MKAATVHANAARSIGTDTKDPELIRDRLDQMIRAPLKVFQEKGFLATTVRCRTGITCSTNNSNARIRCSSTRRGQESP